MFETKASKCRDSCRLSSFVVALLEASISMPARKNDDYLE